MTSASICQHSIDKDIVIFMPRFIGDCIMATPAIEMVKQLYPDKDIVLICRPLIAPIFARDNSVRVLIDQRDNSGKIGGGLKLLKLIRKLKIGIAFLLRNSLADAILAKLSGINILIGYNSDGSRIFLNYSYQKNRNRHYINSYAQLINKSHGNPFDKLPCTQLIHNQDTNSLLGRAIGFYFGDEQKRERQYPLVQCIELFEQLIKSYPDKHFYLLGDIHEFSAMEKLRLRLSCENQNVINIAGKLCLTKLVDFISQLDVLVSIDSGPLHIAAAVNTPYVALVGVGTSPWSIVKPKSKNGIVLLGCGEYIEDHEMIKEITPYQVIKAIEHLVQ